MSGMQRWLADLIDGLEHSSPEGQDDAAALRLMHEEMEALKLERDALAAAHQDRLDDIWSSVNVLGAPASACTTDEERAYSRAIGDALAEIEKLGGRPW